MASCFWTLRTCYKPQQRENILRGMHSFFLACHFTLRWWHKSYGFLELLLLAFSSSGAVRLLGSASQRLSASAQSAFSIAVRCWDVQGLLITAVQLLNHYANSPCEKPQLSLRTLCLSGDILLLEIHKFMCNFESFKVAWLHDRLGFIVFNTGSPCSFPPIPC